MPGIELSLMLPVAAGILGGIVAIAYGKRYVLAAACVIAGLVAAGLWPIVSAHVRLGWEILTKAPPSQWIMTSLLASAATTMALAAFWAGYSRVYWFWRALAPSGFLALLAVLEANEPILLSLIAMPLITIGGWGVRWRQDRQPNTAGSAGPRRLRWSLRDALLAFVIVGLLAFVARSLLQAEMYLVPVDLAITSIVIINITVLGFYSGLLQSRAVRLFATACLAGIVIGNVVILTQRDALGLTPFYDPPGTLQSRLAQLALALAGAAIALWAVATLHRVAQFSRQLVCQRIARATQNLVIAAIVAPWMLVYLRLLPPPTIAPLPPSPTYAKIQAAGQKATGLRTPGFKTAPIVKEAAAALTEPGNVWFDARRFRETELSGDFDRSFHRESMLSNLLDVETAAAEKTQRPGEVLELAILQWKLGRVLRRGGIVMNWNLGWRAELCGCAAVTGVVDDLSDDECRLALTELRRSLTDRPDLEEVKAYDAYWNRSWFGWRMALYRAARELTGDTPYRGPVTDEVLRQIDQRGLLRWRLLETRLALELHHRRHDTWPETLAELMPEFLSEIPIDPFSNRPLIYHRRGESFVLYSVGKDGQDSGGVFPTDGDPDWNFQNGDVDWDCERRGRTNTWPRKKL